jgi:hypothetical protein
MQFLEEEEGRNTARMKKLALHTSANLQEYREARMTAKNMQRNNLWKMRRRVNGMTTAKSYRQRSKNHEKGLPTTDRIPYQ